MGIKFVHIHGVDTHLFHDIYFFQALQKLFSKFGKIESVRVRSVVSVFYINSKIFNEESICLLYINPLSSYLIA